MKVIITNAFSINMLNDDITLEFERVSLDALKLALSRWGGQATSAVGHADVAAIFAEQLGMPVPVNRITVEMDTKTTLVVGQYKGPRLPEGTTELPEGAAIEWWTVGQS
jgi:hypothetical protein